MKRAKDVAKGEIKIKLMNLQNSELPHLPFDDFFLSFCDILDSLH
jgi:hypothetical protein